MKDEEEMMHIFDRVTGAPVCSYEIEGTILYLKNRTKDMTDDELAEIISNSNGIKFTHIAYLNIN